MGWADIAIGQTATAGAGKPVAQPGAGNGMVRTQNVTTGQAGSSGAQAGAGPSGAYQIDPRLVWGSNYYNTFGGSLVPSQMPIFRVSDFSYQAPTTSSIEVGTNGERQDVSDPGGWHLNTSGGFDGGANNMAFSWGDDPSQGLRYSGTDPNKAPDSFSFGIKSGRDQGHLMRYTLDPTGQYYIPTGDYGTVGGRGGIFDTNQGTREFNKNAAMIAAAAAGAYYMAPAAGTDAGYLAAADQAGGMVPAYGTNAGYEAGLAGGGGTSAAAVPEYGSPGYNPGSPGVPQYGSPGYDPSAAAPAAGSPAASSPGGGSSPTTSPNSSTGPTSGSPNSTNPSAGNWWQQLTGSNNANGWMPLLGSLIGAGGSIYAGQQQADAARDATNLQRDIYNQNRADLAPWRSAGGNALSRLQYLLGIGDQNAAGGAGGGEYGSLMRDFSAADMQADPGYEFRRSEGEKAINRNALARGRYNSGSVLKGLQDYNSGLASQEYGNAFNRFQAQRGTRLNALQSLSGTGQSTASQMAQLGQNFGQQAGQNMIGAGNANAAGTVGAVNSINNGLGQWWNYQQSQDMINALRGQNGG